MKKAIMGFIASILVITSVYALYPVSSKNETVVNGFIKKVEQNKFTEDKVNQLIFKLEKLNELRYKGTKSEVLINDLVAGLKNYNIKSQTGTQYDVVSVVDGDTIKINYEGAEKNIRILGLDTPEKYATRTGYKECYGQEASDYATQELSGKKVFVEFDSTQDKFDKYDRLLAHIFYFDKDGNKVYYEENSIKNGFGFYYLYKVPTKYDDMLVKAQEEAKNKNIGVWKMCQGKRIPLDQMIKQTSDKVDSILNTNTSSSGTVVNNTATSSTIVPVTPTIPPVTNSNFSCNVSKTCTKMVSCEEAKFYLNTCKKTSLDADKDGIPCESICK